MERVRLATAVGVLLCAASCCLGLPINVQLNSVAGGELADDDLNGTWDRMFPGDAFSVGGSLGGVRDTGEYQGVQEYDLDHPSIQGLSADDVLSATLVLHPITVGSSAGGAPRLPALAAAYAGDGVFDESDGDRGEAVASFMVYTRDDIPISTTYLDVTSAIQDRIQAGDRYAGFNFRVVFLPTVYGPFTVNGYSSADLLLTVVPEPGSLVLVTFGGLVLLRARRRQCAIRSGVRTPGGTNIP